MSTKTPSGLSHSSRARNAAWLSSLVLVFGWSAISASSQIQQTQEQGRSLGLERTGNFEKAAESVDTLCFAAHPLELPQDYRGLRYRRVPDGDCGFDVTRWDVLSYQPEAIAGEQVGVTPELAAAPEARAGFVVAHEDFHDQPEVKELPAGLHEPAATLAAFLIQTPAANRLDDPTLLFLKKAALINLYVYRASRLYERFRRGEVSQLEALRLKQILFETLESDCKALPEMLEFNRCPASFNNAGLAFDATYTRLYPSLYQLYEASDRDRDITLRVLRSELANEPGILISPLKVLRRLAARLRQKPN